MSTYLVKIGFIADASQIKKIEKNMDKSMKGIANNFIKRISKGMGGVGKTMQKMGKAAAGGAAALAGLGIVGGIINVMMNPLNTIQKVAGQTMDTASNFSSNARYFNSSTGEMGALQALYERNGANADQLFADMETFRNKKGLKDDANVAERYFSWLNQNKNRNSELSNVLGKRRLSDLNNVLGDVNTTAARDAFYAGYGSRKEFERLTGIMADQSKQYKALVAQASQQEYIKRAEAMVADPTIMTSLAEREAGLMSRETSKLSQTAQAVLVAESVDKISNAIQETLAQPEFATAIGGVADFVTAGLPFLVSILRTVFDFFKLIPDFLKNPMGFIWGNKNTRQNNKTS